MLVLSGCGDSRSGVDAPTTPMSGGQEPGAGDVVVRIPVGATNRTADAFGANPLVIEAGQTVTWVNDDPVPHTATSSDQIWDSEILAQGESFSRAFPDAGTFPYLCTVHPGMVGTVEVRSSS